MNAFIYECNWGRNLRLWDVNKKEERRTASFPFGINGVMEYNPVHKIMLFGAGDNGGGVKNSNPNLYWIDREGKVKKHKPPPIHFNCTPTSKLMCDPVSGEYIVKTIKQDTVYAFHPIRDQWKELPDRTLPGDESLGVAIDTSGVLMLLTRTGGRDFRCYLYKHKPVFAASTPEKPGANTR